MSRPHNIPSADIFQKYARRECDEERVRLWVSMLLDGASSANMLLEFPAKDIWISALKRRAKGKTAAYSGCSLVCSGSCLIWVHPHETTVLGIFSRRHGKLIVNPYSVGQQSGTTSLAALCQSWFRAWSPETIAQLNKLDTIGSTFPLAFQYDRFDAAATPLTLSMDLLLYISRKEVNDLSSENRSRTIRLLQSIWLDCATAEGPHNWVSPRGDDPAHVDKLSTDQFLVRGLKHFESEAIKNMIRMTEKYGYPDNALGKALAHMSKFQSY